MSFGFVCQFPAPRAKPERLSLLNLSFPLAFAARRPQIDARMAESTDKRSHRLLLVEDDPQVASSLVRGLREEGFAVVAATRLAEADRQLALETPALVILDLNLPDGDGRTWLRAVRQKGYRMPVVIVTARATLLDRVAGLEEGADDYVTKPFAFAELLARVRTRLRSAVQQLETDVLRVGDLEIDRVNRWVRRAGQLVPLTACEFDVLTLLAKWRGQPVSRDLLADEVWKINRRVTPLDKVINVHISHLREKIERPGTPRLIRTVRGVGFMLGGDAP